MVLLFETLLNNCLSVRFVGKYDICSLGDVLSKNAYTRSHETAFDRIIDPLAAYDPNIRVFKGAHRIDGKKWATKMTNQIIIQATERGACEFILHAVEDMWT